MKRKEDLINVKFSFGKNTLNFRDSYLLLPSSLRNLAISFSDGYKTIFPYKFVNIAHLNYDGPVPEFNYFEYPNYFRCNIKLFIGITYSPDIIMNIIITNNSTYTIFRYNSLIS